MILPARHARAMLRGLLVSALHRPDESVQLLKQAFALLPSALVSLRHRARVLSAMTRVDEWLVMHLPDTKELQWERFLLGHRRLVRTGQMLWMARNPLPSLPAGPESGRWPISTIGQYAVVGLHGLECSDEEVFRWTHPIFLLRFKWTAKAALTLETRNLRRHIGLSDIVVVVAGRALSSRHIALDDTGNITLSIEAPAAASGETDVVVILPELREPAASGGHGRRLGLPLFSVGFAPD